jgi:hypothetical protein
MLKEKAKQLSDQDLLSVMLMRQEKKARVETVAEAAAATAAVAEAAVPAKASGEAPQPTAAEHDGAEIRT